MATAGYHRVAVELRKAASVVVCSHVKPDGDAIASVLALTLALREMGIPTMPTLADEGDPPSTYGFLPGFGLFVSASDLETPDIFVALDTPNLDRLGVAGPLATDCRTLIVLDHHPDNTGFGTVNVTDDSAAATGVMVWRLLRPLEHHPSPEVALCCWVGLMTDTGRFAYSNTTSDALHDAAEMLEAGAAPAEAHRMVYENRTLAALTLEARVLGRITLANRSRVAYAWVEEHDYSETGARAEETEHLVDAIRSVGDLDIAMLLRVYADHVRVNLRAKTGFDVGAVARRWEGGGHRAAAGFTYPGDLETLLGELLPLLPGHGGR